MTQASLNLSGYHTPINLAESLRLRDEGIDRVMENSGSWKEDAMYELERIYHERKHENNEFTFEMLKYPVIRAAGHPSNPNVWGGIAREMRKRGWLREVGTTVSQTVSRHGSICRKYKWGVV